MYYRAGCSVRSHFSKPIFHRFYEFAKTMFTYVSYPFLAGFVFIFVYVNYPSVANPGGKSGGQSVYVIDILAARSSFPFALFYPDDDTYRC